MVIKDLLEEGARELKGLQYTDPSNEAIRIFTRLVDKDESYIFLNLDKELEEDLEERYRELIRLRASGYPFHYIFQEKGFLDLDLYIEEGVLIPRPETEGLVEYILAYIERIYGEKRIDILELGSGSGAISISLAKHCKNARVLGLDIDSKALEVSRKNKEIFRLDNVNFEKSDLFGYLADKGYRYNIIVSNPPYIRSEDIEDLQLDVRKFEPHRALDGGEDGLDFYRAITSQAKDYLERDGLLIYEIGWDQGQELVDILEENNFQDIELVRDFQGHDRIVLGFKE